MKYLLILFFTFSAQAQFKLTVTNGGEEFTFKCELKQICQNLLNENLKKIKRYENRNSFGIISDTVIGKITIDSDFEAIQTAKETRILEIAEIKAMIQKINDSDLPQWHKKLLKAQIRDMK